LYVGEKGFEGTYVPIGKKALVGSYNKYPS